MNAEGGTLIIGVDDAGNAHGLNDDIATLQKKNEDGFELAFYDIIKVYIGLSFRAYIETEFRDYRGERIYVVQITKSAEPVFMKGTQETEFYVRIGNSTRRLDAREMWDYLNKRTLSDGGPK
jgi:predicted HTH transcriptional regulator